MHEHQEQATSGGTSPKTDQFFSGRCGTVFLTGRQHAGENQSDVWSGYWRAARQNSNRNPMRNARAPGWSPVDDPFTPPTPLMTPTLANWLMFVAGLE